MPAIAAIEITCRRNGGVRISSFNLLLVFALIVATALGAPQQATVHYLDLPDRTRPLAIAADAAGNFFVVSTITAPSGKPQIRVLKTDPQGKTLASLDFGGSETNPFYWDTVRSAAVDSKGNLVIVGTTSSDDFPLVSPLKTGIAGTTAFITKLDAQLKNILFSTRLGGTHSGTNAGSLALDKTDNIYVTGSTSDPDFPATPGAFQTKGPDPPKDDRAPVATYAFVTEISSDGRNIMFSSYFGDSAAGCTGNANDCGVTLGNTFAGAVAVDSAGNVIIGGSTSANHLPITAGVFGPNCGDCSYRATAGFLAKLAPGGSKLLWSTYVPVVSAAPSFATSGIVTMVLDTAGNIVVGGEASRGHPITPGALQTEFPQPLNPGFAGFAGFVMKLDPSVQRILFSTYFGGSPFIGDAFGVSALTTDSQGQIWITGASPTTQLPILASTPVLGPNYLASLSPDGSTLINVFTAPTGVAAKGIVSTVNGNITALGASGTLLTASPGQGPSLISIGSAAASSAGAAVAPYELVSLYGFGLGPLIPASAQVVNGRVTTSLGGVQVLFDGDPAPLLYVGPTQINAIVPGSLEGRDTSVLQIVTSSGTLKNLTLHVRSVLPGVFSSGAPAVLTALTAAALNQDGSINSASNPAILGSVVTVWATGTGVSSSPVPDGTILQGRPGGPRQRVSMFSSALLSIIGEGQFLPGPLSLEVLYAGDAVGMVAGVTQINFRLPSQASNLSNFGFTLQIGDASSPPFALYLKSGQ